ncbi:MAG: glycosyltransferase [Myxococcota bacterium]|nr:glycosyltransferase [Myxococcota bacterium]
MSSPLNIVMCEPLTWDSTTKTGSHHYAEKLAESGHRVFWISHDVHLPGVLRRKHPNFAEVKRVGTQENILCWHPIAPIPFRRKPLLDNRIVAQTNRLFCTPQIRRVLKEHGFGTVDLLWLSQGYPSSLALHALKARTTFFRMSDNAAGFEEFPRTYRLLEQELIAQSDHIGITSPALRAKVPPAHHSKIIDCPNGCEWSSFQVTRAVSPSPNRAIFTGIVGSWFNPSFLLEVARACPDWTFDIHGPVQVELGELARQPNVVFHGRFQYSSLPRLLARADAGLIPFHTADGVGEFANPLKAWEYLAAGLPVVTTPLPALSPVPGMLNTAATPTEFADHLRNTTSSTHLEKERREFARSYDWASLTPKLLNQLL